MRRSAESEPMAGVELAFVEYGIGPALLILHGLFGSSGNWSSLARRLAADHQVVAVDARNHGASPWADTMSYRDMAGDVLRLQHRRGFGPAALIGHSMGGKTAMIQALEHGETVRRLVVVDVAPVTYPPALLAYAHAMQAIDLSGISRRSEADAGLAGAVPSAAERAFLLQNIVFDGDRARWRVNLPVIEKSLPELSGFPEISPGRRYDGPALFIAGALSTYLRPEHHPAIKRLFPKAEIVVIPDTGHWLHAEKPEAFLDLVRPFLQYQPVP